MFDIVDGSFSKEYYCKSDHALSRACSQAIVIALSSGNQADISFAEELTECLPENSTLIGDKAYDSSTLRQTAGAKGVKTCIPGRANRTTAVPFSAKLYRRRHRVENFFQRIKRYRRVATRYDKLAETLSVSMNLDVCTVDKEPPRNELRPELSQHFLEGAAVTPPPEILVHRIPAGLWPIDSSPAATLC